MDNAASRYSIALLSVAREENKIEQYIFQCEQILEIIDQNVDLLRILADFGLNTKEKKETIELCFNNKIEQYILNMLYVAIDNGRGNLVKEILEDFVRIAYKDLNIRKGIVYSTLKFDKQELSALEKRVSQILNSKVVLTNKIDESLKGGFKVEVDDFIIDQSIKKRLENLKLQLLNGERSITDGNKDE